ncbi:uncharacterized protein LOC129793052 [Lutzomyia longipalpis]|uniref:uncharacterized protein LOC129793052 n=1 Tax=Lutzomyia longipalpis TaxID=7200 RepID=UPI0024834B3E|nr:uncharacterized protein LOC129793052 [Lutzomyia longipalpis]
MTDGIPTLSERVLWNAMDDSKWKMGVLLCITTTTCVVINSYVHIREKFILGIPYVLEDYVHLQGFIANFFLFYGSLYLTLIEATIIFIGVYFIATLGILSDLIRLLNETTESTGKILKLIVRLQVEIIENFNDYCEALFYVFLIQISTCVFLLVLLFFLLMHTITNAMYLVIIVTVMSQFAMFCFFGQIIHNRSERIFTDLYITKWYEMDVKDQKSLLLAMKMSQRTLGFKVAGILLLGFSHSNGHNVIILILTFSLIMTSSTNMMYYSLNESSKNQPNNLKFIVQFHVEVLEKFEKYCEAFFLVFLVQMATIVIILILTFSLIMTSSTNMMYYSVIATVMLQFTLFCFCGQIIHNKSERIFTDLYQTKWYEMELKEQKILLLMMKMSQRSLGIKVAGMYDINFVMFMQVLKVSFSYCTILYTLM